MLVSLDVFSIFNQNLDLYRIYHCVHFFKQVVRHVKN